MNLIHFSTALAADKATWAIQLEHFTEMRQFFVHLPPYQGGNLFGWAGQMATDNWNHCTQRSVILQQRLWCPILTSHVFHLSVLYFVSYFSVTIFIAFVAILHWFSLWCLVPSSLKALTLQSTAVNMRTACLTIQPNLHVTHIVYIRFLFNSYNKRIISINSLCNGETACWLWNKHCLF